jgi:hypothetical protein
MLSVILDEPTLRGRLQLAAAAAVVLLFFAVTFGGLELAFCWVLHQIPAVAHLDHVLSGQ